MRGSFASLYLACATIAAFAIAAPADAYQAPVEQTRAALGDPINRERDVAFETDLYCLTLAVYFEGGSTDETEQGQRHIAQVVAARARAKRAIWGGERICDVVFYKRGKVCQFSFACLPLAKRTAIKGKAWRYSKEIARDELEGRSGLEDRLLRYYMNAELTPSKNACRFRKEFVPVVQVGRHEFFREATRAERRALEQADHAECRKYEASLKKKKQAKNKKSKDTRTAAAKPKKDGVTAAKQQPPKKVSVAKR